jgi:hypothetical protein
VPIRWVGPSLPQNGCNNSSAHQAAKLAEAFRRKPSTVQAEPRGSPVGEYQSAAMLPLSVKSWQEVKRDWALAKLYRQDLPDTCVCGHYPINEIGVLENEKNRNGPEVGNVCVKEVSWPSWHNSEPVSSRVQCTRILWSTLLAPPAPESDVRRGRRWRCRAGCDSAAWPADNRPTTTRTIHENPEGPFRLSGLP